MNKNLKLTCCGGVGEVTGANFLLESEKTKILIDCGLVQGFYQKEDPNRVPFFYNPSEVDYLFVTHAHIDHIGRIPKLVKEGFRGKIYSTPATKDLARYMLEDALKINMIESRKKALEPLYSEGDIEIALSLWNGFEYHENLDAGDFSVFAKDAGHILGSAIFEITEKESKKKITFTGDLGNSPTPLLKDTEEITDSDYLVMESVYGDRNHEQKALRTAKLKEALKRIIDRKGVLLIPVFSLEKTQVLLHELDNLIENREIPSVPVFLDSPLAIKITEVYARHLKYFKEEIQKEIKRGDDIFNFPKLKMTFHKDQSKEISDTKPPFILIAGSGMSEGGRIMDHEKRFLPERRNALLVIGHQLTGSAGRKIQEGAKKVFINGEKISINAEIITINGYSSHKDSDGLLEFVANSSDTLKKVFVAMGEPKSSLFLSQKIRDNLNVESIVPELNKTYII